MDSFECNLGAAIEHAAGFLPLGYEIALGIEKNGYHLVLLLPYGNPVTTECETLIDEIKDLVAKAIIIERERIA